MKRIVALLMFVLMAVTVFAGCEPAPAVETGGQQGGETQGTPDVDVTGPVEIVVVTSFGGDDGNRNNYENAYKAYEEATGNKVLDASATANEEWKARVMTDFETGSEPDVLFYFNGVDSNKIVEAGKVVSIDEIRSVYPDYASNMKDSMLGASPVDGKNYSVPLIGYWESMFVNKKVLADSGVAVPGAGYTWDQFLADCEKIKNAGFTPIAVSLQEVPHYWFEFVVYNQGSPQNHLDLPVSADDAVGQKWVAGLEDIKVLYERNYLPANTLTATDSETCQMMVDNKAAFLIDGSWKIGWFVDNAANLDDFTVTYVPGKGDRKATDIIGGLSMGYYITRKAWDDPDKRKACVDFVTAMTTDEVVSTFSFVAITALKNGTVAPVDANSLQLAAIEMNKGATGIAPATQDGLPSEVRADLFSSIKDIVTGGKTAAEALAAALAVAQ